jgi:hypothetical protein
MEYKIIILLTDVFSQSSGVLVLRDTVCVYNPLTRAIHTQAKKRKSEVWISVRDSEWEELGWVSVKEEPKRHTSKLSTAFPKQNCAVPPYGFPKRISRTTP